MVQKQQEVARITMKVQEKLSSSVYVNGAERVLNLKSVGSFLLAGVGAITMITNYFKAFGSAKGIAAKFTAGFKDRNFLFGALVAGAGVHLLGSSMTAGKSAPGTFHRLLYRGRSKENPFGTTKEANYRNNQFDILASYLTDYRLLNEYLVNKDGFTDMNTFWNTNNLSRQKIEMEAQIGGKQEKGKTPVKNFYERYIEHVKANNVKGFSYLNRLNAIYGKNRMKQVFLSLFVTTHSKGGLGIISSEHFKTHKNPGNPPFTYAQLLRSRQGLEQLQAPAPAAPAAAPTPAAPAATPAARTPIGTQPHYRTPNR
jgi:hypothetical protein